MLGLESAKVSKHFSFDKENKTYIFYTEKKFGKDLTFSEEAIEQIHRLYCRKTGELTAAEIARKLILPVDVIRHIIRVMGITHSSLPLTENEIQTKDEKELINSVISSKKYDITQKIEKLEWKQIVTEAENWKIFQHNYATVFESFLAKWTPPKYVPVKIDKKGLGGNEELIIGCSDWHFGLYAEERYLYNQKGWNIENTVNAVKNYNNQLVSYLKKQSPKRFKIINLAFLGDLIHGLDGVTDKGTKLEAHPLSEEQLEVAYNSTLEFINNILNLGYELKVFAVPGNHSSLGDYLLLKMLSIYFRNEKRISFELTNKRFLTFPIGNNLFLMDHGYAPTAKSRLPAHGASRENYINNLFMAKPETLNAKHLYYLSGDQHHVESGEMTNVESYMFSTLVGGCKYSDHSGYKSRQRQNALVVDSEKGVTEFLHFYLD